MGSQREHFSDRDWRISTEVAVLFVVLCFFVAPTLSFADFEITYEPTIRVEHSNITLYNGNLDDPFIPPVPTVIHASDLTAVNTTWTIEQLTLASHDIPATRGVYILERIDPITFGIEGGAAHRGVNYDVVHAAWSSSATSTFSPTFSMPALGDPATPSGTYLLFFAEVPETKDVYDPNINTNTTLPFTDDDIGKVLAKDPDFLANVYAPVFFYPAIQFDYVADVIGCTLDCNSNVLFLPGIEGSRLYRPDYAGGTDRLWEPTSNSDARDLFMTADGTSVRSDIYTKDVMDEAYGTLNIYKSFLANLDAWKNTDHIIADYSAVPYDWRLSLEDILNNGNQLPDGRIYYSGDLRATSTPYIMQELRRLAASSRTGKVTIVAHSNGGLVAKALLKRLQDTNDPLLEKIDIVIMVAVPQTGTPKAIGSLLHGFDQALPTSWAPFTLSADTARIVAQNMPSAYNLLPSFQYFTYTDDSVVTFDDSSLLAPWRTKYGEKIHSSERLRNFLTDSSRPPLPTAEAIKNPIVGNAALLANAETLHNTALDNWTPPSGVRIIEIAGWGEDTIKTIAYYQGTAGTCTERRSDSTCAAIVQTPVLDYKPERVVDGDGTVVVSSALWTTSAEKYWVNLSAHNGLIRINPEQHHNILEVSELRTFIQNLITNTTTTLPDFISTTQPAADPKDSRLHFTLHSPLTLDLYDNLGNHTGIATSTGFLEENIPGSRYERFGGITYATTPASTTIRLIARGYAEGSFTLDMEETRGNVTTANTTFAGIPSGTTTIVTLAIPQGGGIANSSPLSVDENGDGTSDLLLRPRQGSVVIPDVAPPAAVFTFSTTTNDLILSGKDDLSPSVSITPSSAISTSTLVYVLADESGNTATIVFKKIKEKDSKNERGGMIKAKLFSVVYTTLSTTTKSIFSENEIQYEWERNKDGSPKELEQNVKVRKDFALRARYDAKKNETKIYFIDRESKEKLKETKSGIVLIRIMTNNGVLGVEY